MSFKHKRITTTYRCYKHFNETNFLAELTSDLDTFVTDQEIVEDDLVAWPSLILKHLSNHAPVKTKRVKTKRLPDWFTPEITHMQSLRDNCKRLKQWTEYKNSAIKSDSW